jgi:hypothetical protein
MDIRAQFIRKGRSSSCVPFFKLIPPQHVASNAYTRYRPYPTPAQFAASPDLISRTTMFLRRELQVWVNLDVEVQQFQFYTVIWGAHSRYLLVSHHFYYIDHESDRYTL